MNYIDSNLKVVGTRPIRPDGVDKVTGRAVFAADTRASGMLWGKILRSPHAHARIVSIDTSKAEKLPGVQAVVTAKDFPEIASEEAFVGEGPMNFRDLSGNVMARTKALYEGHAVAAVAATTQAIADDALALIEVKYDVLPFVIDVDEAMADNAPVLHDDMFTGGVTPKPTKASNIAKVVTFKKGDVDAGFKDAEVIVEGTYTTKPVHQGYIEPHACLATYAPDGQITIHSSSQGHFMVRAYTAKLLGIDIANIRCTPAEIGGGFGGKTLIYLEPVAVALSKKSGKSVKMQMTREDVFRGSGPTSGASIDIKIGAKKDGTVVAAKQVLKFQAGAYAGSPIGPGCMCGFALYDIENVDVVGYDVVSNRPKVAAYRAPGAPITSFAVESALDELADKLGMDPLTLRKKNAAKAGTKTHYGVTHANIGFEQVLAAVETHPHWKSPVKAGQARGFACGFWFNIGGDRQPGYRRLARLDGDDGGRGAWPPGREGADDRRRHRFDRLHLPDRRFPGHLRHRNGGDPGGRESGRRVEKARRHDLGNPRRRRRVERRHGVPGGFQRRCLRAARSGGDHAQGGPDRWPDQRRGLSQRTRRRGWIRRAYL